MFIISTLTQASKQASAQNSQPPPRVASGRERRDEEVTEIL
jgi:hypothetical protein